MRWFLTILSFLGGILTAPVGLSLAYLKLRHFWHGLGNMQDFIGVLDVIGDFLAVLFLLLVTLVIAGKLLLKGIELVEGAHPPTDAENTPLES